MKFINKEKVKTETLNTINDMYIACCMILLSLIFTMIAYHTFNNGVII